MPGTPHPLLIGRDLEALDAWRRGLAQAGVTVAGVLSPVEAPLRLRLARPSLLVLVLPWEMDEARQTLERCRAAAEVALPAVLLLWPTSPWLHTAVPVDLEPAVALDVLTATAPDLMRAARVMSGDSGMSVSLRMGALVLDHVERRLTGPSGDAFLTPSESTLLAVLLARPQEVVRVEEIARALWGTPLGDPHARAAVRTHLHTLRRKLTSVGAGDAIRSIAGVGYRLRVGMDPSERAG